MKLRRWLPLICVVLLLSMTLLTVASCKSAETPETKFATSVTKTSQQVQKWDEYKLMQKIMNGGSIRIQTTIPADEDVATDTDVDAIFYINEKDRQCALDATVKAGGQSYSGMLYLDPDRVVAESNDLLGGAYGLDLTTIATQLENSILAPGKSDFSMDEETFATLKKLPELLKKASELESKEQATFDKLVELLMKSILANATVSVEKGTTTVFGKEVKANIFSVSLDQNSVAAVLEGFWKSVKEDEGIRASIDSILALTKALPETITEEEDVGNDGTYTEGDDSDFTVGDLELPDLGQFDSAENLFKALDPMISEAAAKLRALPAVSAALKLSLNKSGMIMRADLDVTVTEGTVSVALELGEKLTSFEGFSLNVSMKAQGLSMDLATVKAEISEDSKSNYVLDMNARIGAGPTSVSASAELTYDKKDGATELKINVPDTEQIVISLNYTNKKGTHTIKDLQIKKGTESLPIPAFTLTIKESDPKPAYNRDDKDVQKMTAEELNAFGETVKAKIDEISKKLAPAGKDI